MRGRRRGGRGGAPRAALATAARGRATPLRRKPGARAAVAAPWPVISLAGTLVVGGGRRNGRGRI